MNINGASFAWIQDSILLQGLTGFGNENVLIRFRMVADGAVEKAVIYINDIEVVTDDFIVLTTEFNDDRTFLREFVLSQNHHNPFNSQTTIRYSLPQKSHVIVKVYNALGKEVATLIEVCLEYPSINSG